MKFRWHLALLLFTLLGATYAYFWQSRDWNNASRLMMTYALVDRGTLWIDGLETHVGGDLARSPSNGHLYTEKAPGQSLVGVPVYAAAKALGGYGDHPLNHEARPFWSRDYWVTLGTCGLATAMLGVLLYAFSLRLGTSHGQAVLLAAAYGLGTPAFTYATLFYGHQTAALALAASFFLLYQHESKSADRGFAGSSAPGVGRMLTAGLLAGFAVVIELPTLFVCGVIWLYGASTLRQWRSVLWLTAGMAAAGSVLLVYNWLAFGHPLTPGYRFVIYEPFAEAHANPLVVGGPKWDVLPMLLFSPARGLFVYAPIMLLATAALVALLVRRQWALALVPLGGLVGLLLVNISHQFWEGGLATGPRHLLPAVPLLMLPLAGLLGSVGQRAAPQKTRPWMRGFWIAIGLLTLLGVLIATACTAAGGRFSYPLPPGQDEIEPDWSANPLAGEVLPGLREGELARNLGGMVFGEAAPWWLQLLPLVALWAVIGTVVLRRCRRIARPKTATQ